MANFAAILVCQLFIFAMFSSVMPFLPLYLRELGEDEAGAVRWAGLTQSVSAGVLLVATPLWGALADRVGQKTMVLRALFGSALSIILMGFITQAWHLVVLRALQGATAGTNSAVIALAATVLPSARLGVGMGMLQTAQFLGSSLGPLIGGVGTATLGFKGTFFLSGALLLGAAGLVTVLVREPPRPAGATQRRVGLRRRLALVVQAPRLRAPILAILGFQTAWAVSATLLPLHVYAVAGAGEAGTSGTDATAAVGLVLTAGALGVALGAAALGWLGGRWGVRAVALASLAATALLSLPQVWFSQPLQFIPLRFALGFCAGGVLPSLRAVLGQEASNDPRLSGSVGAVYGLAQSAFAGGMVLGPALSSFAASVWGLPAIHATSAAVLAGTGLWYWAQGRTVAGAARDAVTGPPPRASV